MMALLAIRTFLWALGMHPSARDLVGYFDGELEAGAARRVRTHLTKCERCKAQSMELKSVLAEFDDIHAAALDPDVTAEEGLATIQNAIDALHSAATTGHPVGGSFADTELGRRVAEVLEIYLGRRTATALLEAAWRGAATDQRILSAADPILREFLGRRSAVNIQRTLLATLRRAGSEQGTRSNNPDI
jgi:hypothetical protein